MTPYTTGEALRSLVQSGRIAVAQVLYPFVTMFLCFNLRLNLNSALSPSLNLNAYADVEADPGHANPALPRRRSSLSLFTDTL
jgi:hypothetical protein